jgi:hypothetical protein
VHDSHDFRGEGAAIPRTFGRLATAQPEFGECMARRVADHVFGQDASGDDYRAVDAEYDRDGTYQSMLRVALHRLLDRRLHPELAQSGMATNLPKLIDARCIDCHSDEQPPNLGASPLDQSTLLRALEEVSTGRMPKGFPPLGARERMQMVDALIGAWPAADERSQLLAVYGPGSHRMTAMRLQTVQHEIHERAQGTEPEPSTIPLPYASLTRKNIELTPDFLLFAAMESVQACKKRASSDERATCATHVSHSLLFK